MMTSGKREKGYAHIALLVAVLLAVRYVGNLIGTSEDSLGLQSTVLSESDDKEDNSGSSHDEDEKEEDEKDEEDEVDEIDDDFESELELGDVTVKTKREDNGRERVDVYRGNTKVRFETRNGHTTIKVEDEDEEDFDEEDEVEIEDGNEIRVRTRDGKFLLERNRVAARTNFPLTVDTKTNELIVTTPSGVKRVAVLPDSVIAKMIAQGFIDVASSPSGDTEPTPTGVEGEPTVTLSPTPTESIENEVELVEEDGELAYQVEGDKTEKLLGLWNVSIRKRLIVSATTGELLDTRESFFNRILDLLSV